jgi:ubiquinol-cytochrome c reductase cytochrome b subunit
LYAWPFVEKLFSSDKGDQNVLRMPYEQPILTAGGAGLFTFLLVLLIAGGDDFLAIAIRGSIVEVRTILRILVLLAPPCAAALTYVLCVTLRNHKAALSSAQDPEQTETDVAYSPFSGIESPLLPPTAQEAVHEGD